ncbi:carbon-nitrogen hydrolase family protein [Helicobacter monodelphidis]|uniref:carbon-nitrogen hydrolase family protein n=1 Tax=Helicobacter sp. 15-1451 TaxID=2004995 RepID=UPI000DCF1DED|nr:carbon-nitrogen hydrolase family protein [Helicobacter sp. 15-1451]RAX58816.1 carbon-nitrogen hydrolase family protein [Helicobacter sp. 15-1451]
MADFNIAALQLSTLAWGDSKLGHYWKICDDMNIELLLLGEYVLNLFFKEFESIPNDMNEKQSLARLENIIEMSRQYRPKLLAPIIRFSGRRVYKSLAIIHQGEVEYYDAQRLLAFEHWNEKAFFSNSTPKNLKNPPIFTLHGLKVGVIFGFEVYFDEIWIKFKKLGVDVVLVSSVCTFESMGRWREILKTRAFLGSCYILRANRVGEYIPSENDWIWRFYGDSLFISPSGDIESSLEDKEGLLTASIYSEKITEEKKNWQFR